MIAALGPAFLRVMAVILTLPFIAQALKQLGGGSGIINSLAGAVYGTPESVQPVTGSGAANQATPAPGGGTTSGPSAGSILKDLTSNPFGAAALVFTSVFLIAQLRGAARDVGDGFERTTNALRDPEKHIDRGGR